jgi:hypothetical protein
MLLNRESNPGLPRLVVIAHMTTDDVVSEMLWWIEDFSVDAYAEIIATRPLGIVTNWNSLMVVFHEES